MERRRFFGYMERWLTGAAADRGGQVATARLGLVIANYAFWVTWRGGVFLGTWRGGVFWLHGEAAFFGYNSHEMSRKKLASRHTNNAKLGPGTTVPVVHQKKFPLQRSREQAVTFYAAA